MLTFKAVVSRAEPGKAGKRDSNAATGAGTVVGSSEATEDAEDTGDIEGTEECIRNS
jgi:hypothetical protein